MQYIWGCSWTNGAWDWKDSHECRALCRDPFKSEAAAKKAAKAHESRTGHHGKTWIRGMDGRKLRHWKKW